MIHKRASSCIVASTLPAGFIAENAELYGIDRVYVLSRELEQSYRFLGGKIQVQVIPESGILQFFYFLLVLIRSRVGSRSILFFHECCLPIFDILVYFVRPRGYFFPQVTLSGWKEIAPEEFPPTKMWTLLRTLKLDRLFSCYQSVTFEGGQRECAISIKKYPKTIASHSVTTRGELNSSMTSMHSKNVLLITGKCAVPLSDQIALYSEVARIVKSKGYRCFVKDHPNPNYRLNLSIDDTFKVDPFIPVELLDIDFKFAVGVSSTALLYYGDSAVSFLNIPGLMPIDSRSAYEEHFRRAGSGNGVRYLDSLDEFSNLLTKRE